MVKYFGFSLCLLLFFGIDYANSKDRETLAEKDRWQKLNANGQPIDNKLGPWSCILDRQTGLVWEVKSWQEKEQYYKSTYSWFADPLNLDFSYLESNSKIGKPLRGSCHQGREIYSCDTSFLVDYARRTKICGITQWRIPRLSELQTLVYPHAHEGQVKTNTYLFPRTSRLPYWTADVVFDQSSGELANPLGNDDDFHIMSLNFYTGEAKPLSSHLVASLRLVATMEQSTPHK